MIYRSPSHRLRNYLRRHPAKPIGILHPFAYGRTALHFGLQSLGIKPGQSILVPETICDVVLHPLNHLHLEARFFPLNDQLEPIWEELPHLIDDSTQAILAVHYFGQPQPLKEYWDFCEQTNLWLIEDNAHGYGASYDGHPLGTWGKMGFTSPRKSFPILNGALLYLDLKSNYNPVLPLEPALKWKQRLKHSLRATLQSVPGLWHRVKKRPPFEEPNLWEEGEQADYQMDQFSFDLLLDADLPALKLKRQLLYQIWEQWTLERGLTPVFETMHAESMPWVFAAYTEDAEQTLKWFDWGHVNGIDVHAWPTLPRKLRNDDQAAFRRWQRMVVFPIHQGIDPLKLEKKLAQSKGFPTH